MCYFALQTPSTSHPFHLTSPHFMWGLVCGENWCEYGKAGVTYTRPHTHTQPYFPASNPVLFRCLLYFHLWQGRIWGHFQSWIMANGSAATSIWYHSMLSILARLSLFGCMFAGVGGEEGHIFSSPRLGCPTGSWRLSFWIVSSGIIPSLFFFFCSANFKLEIYLRCTSSHTWACNL